MEVNNRRLQYHSIADLAIYGLSYVLCVHMLRRLMSGCKPIQLRSIKIIYNIIMSLFSLWCFIGIFRILLFNWRGSDFNGSLYLCDPENKLMEGMDFYFYIFYLSKYIEYADTLFLILAQKSDIDIKWILHVYHHFVTPSISWSAWHYPVTSAWLGPVTNSFVHVIMYAYYAIAILDHRIRKWASWVTTIQLIQFTTVLVTLLSEAINGRRCIGNIYTYAWLMLQYAVFLILFALFFSKKSAKQKAISKIKNSDATVKKTN